MRFFLVPALALSALALVAYASGASAQSCTPPSVIQNVTVHAGCNFDHFPATCAPGGTMVLSVDVRTFSPQMCPYTITWDFGDGTQEQTTTNTVEHVYATVGRRTVKASVQTQAGVRSASNTYEIAYGYFDIKPISSKVKEGGSFTITVTRPNPSVGASIDYATHFDPALVQKSGTLSFAPGETQKQVTFQTIKNAAASEERRVRVGWSNPVNYLLDGSQWTTFATVTDDDKQTFHRCRASSLSVKEPEGVARIAMDRSGETGVASTGTVTITQRFGAPDWRKAFGTFSVAFEPGQTEAFIDVPIENNNLWDGVQQAKVACGGFVDPSSKTTNSELLLTVFDDDPQPRVTVPPVVTVTESDATRIVTIPVTLSAAHSYMAFVAVKAAGNTADEDDFELKSLVATFAPGQTSAPIEIELTGDDAAENDEQLTITLFADVEGTFKVKIVDDDRAPFSVDFDQPSYTVDEASASLTLTRSGDTSAPGTVNLHFEPIAGHGDWPADFDVAFAAGETTKLVPIPADDQWYTGDRTATLELRSAGLAGATADVTLHDDDPQPIVSILGATVREGAPGETATAIVTILLSAPLGLDLDVRATTADGTAGAGDYEPLDAKRVSIAAGQMAATVTLGVSGDDVDEEDEAFTLTLTQCCNPAATTGALTATVTIRDDDTTTPPPPSRRRSVRH